MKEIENFLKELGFSEYETRTYLTLNVHGVCTAEEISRLANIPLPRVYDTIGQLQSDGFVMVTKTRPQRCKANEIETSLKNYLERKRLIVNEEIEDLLQRTNKLDFSVLEKKAKPPTKEEWRIWAISGKKNIIKMRHRIENKAEKEMLMFSGDASFIKEDYDILENLIKKGVKIKLIMKEPKNKIIEDNIKKIRSLGVEVRTGYKGLMRGDIVDSKNVLSVIKYGKGDDTGVTGDEKQFTYEFLILNNPVFVKTFKNYFELNWNNLK